MKKFKVSSRYFARSYGMRLLLGTLVALVVADGLISNFVVAHGLAREGNPFLQRWIGEDAFLALKLSGAFLAALVLWDIYRHNPRMAHISATFFVLFYTFIVFWSLYVFLAAQV